MDGSKLDDVSPRTPPLVYSAPVVGRATLGTPCGGEVNHADLSLPNDGDTSGCFVECMVVTSPQSCHDDEKDREARHAPWSTLAGKLYHPSP